MSSFLQYALNAVNNISIQVEGLESNEVTPDLLILGNGSPFDSFALLLLLVELEQSVEANVLCNRSLVEWFSSFDFVENRSMTLKQFSEYLRDYLQA